MAYQMRFLPPLQALMGMYANLATVRVSLRRVAQILDEPVEVRRARSAVPLTGRARRHQLRGRHAVVRPRRAGARSSVVQRCAPARCSRLSARAEAASRRLPICCCGCSIPTAAWCGSTAAICAPCGSTTCGRRVALVDQEPCMFHATIAENIRYARPDATDADVAHCRASGGAGALHRASARPVSTDRRRARHDALGGRASAHRARRARSWRTRRS